MPNGEQNKIEQTLATWHEAGMVGSISGAQKVLRTEREERGDAEMGDARGHGRVNAASAKKVRERNRAHAELALKRRRHICLQSRREL